jgi:hypothetical protein
MIMEDDLGLAFEVDFTELIETASTMLSMTAGGPLATIGLWVLISSTKNDCKILHRVTDKLMVADIIAIDKYHVDDRLLQIFYHVKFLCHSVFQPRLLFAMRTIIFIIIVFVNKWYCFFFYMCFLPL